jgi:hypothetical protein
MVELSTDSRFHVLEREKVQHVVDELNLTSSGLTSRESVAKAGHLLACDWLISGTIVKADSGTFLWTKVISVKDGMRGKRMQKRFPLHKYALLPNPTVGIFHARRGLFDRVRFPRERYAGYRRGDHD